MNTILPAFKRVRGLCVSRLTRLGLIRPKKRRHEVQLEFRWR